MWSLCRLNTWRATPRSAAARPRPNTHLGDNHVRRFQVSCCLTGLRGGTFSQDLNVLCLYKLGSNNELNIEFLLMFVKPFVPFSFLLLDVRWCAEVLSRAWHFSSQKMWPVVSLCSWCKHARIFFFFKQKWTLWLQYFCTSYLWWLPRLPVLSEILRNIILTPGVIPKLILRCCWYQTASQSSCSQMAVVETVCWFILDHGPKDFRPCYQHCGCESYIII